MQADRHGGRIVNTAGDGLLADFPSVVEAVHCAVEVQRELAARVQAADPDRAMRFRIGIHLGDVVVDGGDPFDPAPLAEAAAWIEAQRIFWNTRLDALERELSQPEATAQQGRGRCATTA